jgi:hypothetical protein
MFVSKPHPNFKFSFMSLRILSEVLLNVHAGKP